tara:strand:+ start:47 stop:832 length:786 start_codon:yes stop_codon:yes gene_type:complete
MRLVCLLSFFFLSCSSVDKTEEAVVARVNDLVLTKQELGFLIGGQLNERETLVLATHRWVEKTLLYTAARGVGLDKDKNLINQKNLFYQDLLTSAYLDIQKKDKIKVTREEVSLYYSKNKKSFFRKSDETVVKHFVLPTKKEAQKIKNLLQQKKTSEELETKIKEHKPKTKTLTKNSVKDNLVGFVFSGRVGDILGPKKHGGFFHVIELLRSYKAGSPLGLELVYDEVYNRLYKEKEIDIISRVLDSLYLSYDVFISPEMQ